MDSGMRTIYSYRLNKRSNLNFLESYLNQQSPEKVQRVNQLNHCDNSKNNDISTNVNNDISSSQKFRQKFIYLFILKNSLVVSWVFIFYSNSKPAMKVDCFMFFKNFLTTKFILLYALVKIMLFLSVIHKFYVFIIFFHPLYHIFIRTKYHREKIYCL